MTRQTIIVITCLTFLLSCDNATDKATNKTLIDSTSQSAKNNLYKSPEDSVDVRFIPITKNVQKNPIVQLLLDSLFRFKKIQSLVADSSADIYILHDVADGEDTASKAFRLNKERMRVDIRNFDKSYYYLCLSYSYRNKSIYVLNNCKSKDSCSLADWNKNCW